VRLDVRHRLKPPSSPAEILARHAWKLGLGVVVAVLLTARGAGPVYTHPHALATSVVPTTVPCGDIKLDAGSADTATWTATSSPYGTSSGSPYILPHNDPLLPTTDPNNPNCLTASKAADEVHVPAGIKLVIDGSQGPVQIFSHGTGIFVNGGQLKTISTDTTNTVVFDAEPDVPSWDGINVSAADPAHRGNASLSFVSIQHALTAITITSGATSSPDNVSYGLTVRNSGIGPSYFDGIDAINTPISVTGRVDPLTQRPDGQFGTLNNIGSQGIKVTYDPGQPNYPANLPGKALDVESMTFGSSVPFGETSCVPLSPCAAGSIGNDAIQGSFIAGQMPIKLDNNSFFRAGSYGLELTNANNPMITNNIFTCNGSGSAKPVISCVGSGLRYSAIFLSSVTNLNIGASGLNNNKGQQNGLDAIVMNGQVVSDLPWLTPSNDPNPPTVPPLPPNPPHTLGYIVASGDLQLVGTKLTVKDGDVVKVKGGAILITNGSLDASTAGLKTFTSLRDNTVGIQACPSVFVQSCPSPLPANEWIGLTLVGSTGNIANASILFPTKAIDISGGKASLTGPDGGAYGLVVTNSRLGPTFSDSVAVNGTPAYISTSKFCRIDTVQADLTYLQCMGAGPGDHGINASYTGTPPAGGGLKLLGNDFQGSTNEAIVGTALGGRVVDIENDTVEGAGTYGIHLVSADSLILKANVVTGSGVGTPGNSTTYAAIYLDGISKADFSGPINANTGTGNGLDAIAFHGSTATAKPLNWKTVGAAGGALGYIVDGDLAVNGDLTLAAGDYAPVLGGAITVHNGTFSSTGAVLSSLKEQAPHLPSCGSVFVPKISSVCPVPAPGDWTGLILDPGKANQLTDSEVRYAVTGISVGPPTVPPVPLNLTMIRSNVRNTAADGVATQSPVSITDGAFTGNGGRGIKVDLTGVSPISAQQLVINGHTSISGSGQDGILAIKLGGLVQISGVSVDHAGAFGINLRDAGNLTLTDNTVTNSAATYPAIYLNGFNGAFATIHGNKGAGNGIDAIAFHGTVTDNLTWQTARKTTDPTQPLGYVLDNTLNMQAGNTLTVNAGDIVKVGNGGALNLQGAALRADDTGSSVQKILTSLTDNSAGVVACPSVLQSGCGPAAVPAPGDWAGITLSGTTAKGTVVNASVRYAGTGISITNGATSTYGSSSFGLVVSQSIVASSNTDGIFASNTPISVTDSSINGGIHGASVTLTNAAVTPAAVRLSGNQFMSQSAEAILGQGLFGQPVWITDNRIQNAGTFGIRLLNGNNLVLRNNNVVGSGGGPGAGAGRYPAIYLPNVSADFAGNVRGNVGSGNGLDSIAFDGTVTSNMTWVTPGTNATTGPLGYLLDGGLTLDGTTLTVNPDGVVKALGGPITINGGSLNALGTLGHEAIFTSLKDNALGVVANAVSCPSVFVSASDCAQPQAGNWGGIAITDKAGQRGNNTIDHSVIEYAITGISIDSGPVTTALPNLKVTNSKIVHTSLDGIRASDTPIDIETTTVGGPSTVVPGTPPDIRGNGIIATFFSPAGCPSPTGCVRLTLKGNKIYSTGKDGIVANGLGGQPTVVQDNLVSVSGTYGIRLVGADQLTLTGNTVNNSGIAANAYPAIYLNNVTGEFNTAITANSGAGNGLNALVFHGTVNTTSLQPDFIWLTPDPAGVQPLGYMLDGALTVNGNFKATNGVVKMLNDGITINGTLSSSGTTFTTMKEAGSPSACNSVFVPAGCPVNLAASDYWGGISVVGGTSTITGGSLRNSKLGLTITNANFAYPTTPSTFGGGLSVDHVTGNGIKLINSDAKFSGVLFTNITGTGNYAINSAGGKTTIDCSSFHENTNGVSFDGTSSISDSDVYHNTTNDVVGTGGTPTATGVWWGTANTGGNVSGVTVSELLSSQSPVFSDPPTPGGKVEILGSNPTATDTPALRALGIGTMTVKLTSSRRMDPNTAPTVTFMTGAIGDPTRNVTTQVGGTWNNRVWTSNPYPLDTLDATAGLNHLSVSGSRSCIPDGPRTAISPNPKDFNAAVLPTVVAVQSGATATYGGTTILSATLKSGGAPVVNETVSPIHFTILDAASNSFATATAGTDGGGLATTAAISIAGLNASPPTYGLSAVFLGDNLYSVSNTDSSQTLLINKVATVTTSAASGTSVKTGTAVTDQATITGAASSTAGGTVTYNLFNTIGCTGSPVFTNTSASFTNGSVPASAAWTAMPPAIYQWQATYNGDGNHLASTSACGSDSVTVSISTPTIATAVAPVSPVATGTSVKDQATLTGATSNAGGTVTYRLYSGTGCSVLFYTSNPATVTNGVVAQSAPSTAPPVGTYNWQATYSGDINNQGATSTCGDPLVVKNILAVISSVSPVNGTVAGKTPVTISGTNMANATAVTFGGVAGTIVSGSDTQIVATTPPDSAGAVDILITTPSGTSLANAPTDQYTFVTYAATIAADSPSIFWRLGEANGLAGAADASGTGHTGAYTSTGVAYSVAGAPVNDTDTAVTLDGLTGAIQETSGAGAPIGSSPRSLEVWFKTTTTAAQPLFNYGTSGLLSQFAVNLAGNQVQVKDGTDPLLTVTAASSLADGAWHHLVVTYDGATSVAIYVDGAAVGSTQTTTGVLATALDVTGLEVGRDNAVTPVFFNGTLDEAAIYSAALSPARVAAHFAAGEGG
jgi:Concanavalin A-like lectin/glucanases superfamily/IPT/TIG domain